MLITFFYALFGAILLLIALFNSGFKIFGKETNKSELTFLLTTYFFGVCFLIAGIYLSIMEKKEALPQSTEKIAANITSSESVQKKEENTETPNQKDAGTNEESADQGKIKENATQAQKEKPPVDKKTEQPANQVTSREEPAHDRIPKGWARITSPEKFVTCRNVKNLQPIGITDKFSAGDRIYVWAQIYEPRQKETVKLVWKNSAGQVIYSVPMKIEQNMGAGYRTFYWKYLDPGFYTVSLINGNGDEIGRVAFEVE